jgi:hypothetical protein
MRWSALGKECLLLLLLSACLGHDLDSFCGDLGELDAGDEWIRAKCGAKRAGLEADQQPLSPRVDAKQDQDASRLAGVGM